MIHVTALQSRVWLIDNPLRGTDGIEVFIQLGHTDFIDTCHHKAASRCLIQEKTRIIIEAIQFLHLPLTLRVCSRQEEVTTIGKLFMIEGDEVKVKLTLVVFQTRSPLPFGILIISILEIKRLRLRYFWRGLAQYSQFTKSCDFKIVAPGK